LINHVFTWLWERPLLAPAAATANRRAIEIERFWRGALALWRYPDRPVVNWHDGGNGEALVLLNGFTGSGLAWPGGWLRRLEQRYRVIRIDNRGTGWSRNAPAPFTIGDMADDVRDVLDALEIDSATVFGMSMGGMIAQEFAIRHPARLRRMVLAATIPPMPAAVLSPHGVKLGAKLFRPMAGDSIHPDSESVAEQAALWLEFAGETFMPPADLVDEMGQEALTRVTPMMGVFMQSPAIGSWSGPGRLRRIEAPTVLLHGEDDRVVPIENGVRLARLIPGAELVRLPKVGHLVPWEAEAAILRALGMTDADLPE
jgi:pimeloyl-ACP methyl ester carboxylesterase